MDTATTEDDAIIVREVDGELVVLDTRSNLVHRLNHTASIILRMWRDGATAEAIAASLARDFDVAEDRALEDVCSTLKRLHGLNLLHGHPQPLFREQSAHRSST